MGVWFGEMHQILDLRPPPPAPGVGGPGREGEGKKKSRHTQAAAVTR